MRATLTVWEITMFFTGFTDPEVMKTVNDIVDTGNRKYDNDQDDLYRC